MYNRAADGIEINGVGDWLSHRWLQTLKIQIRLIPLLVLLLLP